MNMAIMAQQISVCVYSILSYSMLKQYFWIMQLCMKLISFGGPEDFAERPSSKPKTSKRSKKQRGAKDKKKSDATIDHMRQLEWLQGSLFKSFKDVQCGQLWLTLDSGSMKGSDLTIAFQRAVCYSLFIELFNDF